MSLLRPTLQGRKGFNPNGYGPGVNAPFGTSKVYKGYHHGQDYFWLSAASASAAKLKISVADSKNIYPVMAGEVVPTSSKGLGTGAYQQIDKDHRAYYWHMSRRIYGSKRKFKTTERIGIMGHTGTAAGSADHLHFEIRKAPYRDVDRVNPEPFFAKLDANERKVGPGGVHKRQKPTSSSKSLAIYSPGDIKEFQGYVKAPAPDGSKIESVGGSSVWYVTGDGYYSHSSGYTSSGTSGLSDLTAKRFPASPPTPAPQPEPEPVDPGPVPTPDPEPSPEPKPEPSPEPPEEPEPQEPAPEPEVPGGPTEPEPEPTPQPSNPSGWVGGIIALVGLALASLLGWLFGN